MRDIAVVVVTVDRQPKAQNYLEATLDNLARAGVLASPRLHGLHIVDSGGSEAWPDAAIVLHPYRDGRHHVWRQPSDESVITVHRPGDGQRRTPNENVATALLVGAGTDARWVLFLEDDIDVCGWFLDSVGAWLDAHARDDRRVYAFGAAYQQILDVVTRGGTSWDYPVSAFYGTQAFAVRHADARSLAEWLFDHPRYLGDDGVGRDACYDLAIHRWSAARYPTLRFFLASAPSFVQHTGRSSVIQPRAVTHTFDSWPGRDWSYVNRVAEVVRA